MGASLLLAGLLPAQMAQPQPIATDTPEPVATPAPLATPAPAGTLQITLTPGLPDPSMVAAYFAARTPLVGVALGTATNPAAPGAAVLQRVLGGACLPIVLQRPAAATSQTTG